MSSREFKAITPSDRLPILILDLISYCNLKCVMCPQGNEEIKSSTPRGQMSFELYKKIIDEITSPDGLSVNAILPFWNGEALMHPEFKEMVDYAAMRQKILRGFNVFSMHTNFLLADKPMIESIVNSQIFGPITLSIDAATDKTYSDIRRGGNYDRLLENIDYLLYYRNKKGFSSPSLTTQFIVMEKNFDELIDFKKKFTKKFQKYNIDPQIAFRDNADFSKDTVYFRLLQTGDPALQSDARTIHQKAIKLLGFEEKIISKDTGKTVEFEPVQSFRPPCVVLWQQLAIRYDGQCSPCCRDIGLEMDLGNVSETSLKDIFWGEQINAIRNDHLLGKFKDYPLCSGCIDQTDHKLERIDVEDYLNAIGNSDIFIPYLKRMGEKVNTKETLYSDAKGYFDNKEYQKAIAIFTKASKLYPESPEIWSGLGEAYGMIGHFEEARKNFKSAMEIGRFNPESPLDAYCFGHSLYKAKDSFIKALLLDKKLDYYYSIGKTALLLRNFDEALKYLLLSGEKYNDDLSLCYYLSGELKKSLEYYSKDDEFKHDLEIIIKDSKNKKSLTVIRAGDSHTEMAGRTVSPGLTYSATTNIHSLKIINLGVGGDTVSDLYHRIKRTRLNGKIIVIFVGINDAIMKRDISEFRENYIRLIEHLAKKKVILVTLPQPLEGASVTSYNNVIIELSAKYNILRVDLHDDDDKLLKHYLHDGLHFDRNGLKYIESRISNQINNTIISLENKTMTLKHYYDIFIKTRNTNDYIRFLNAATEQKRFRTALIIQNHYKVKNIKVYAYLANIYQNCGELKRATKIYYKLAKRFDPEYWEYLAYCLRLRKKYILSSFAYLLDFSHSKRFDSLKKALYNILLILNIKK